MDYKELCKDMFSAYDFLDLSYEKSVIGDLEIFYVFKTNKNLFSCEADYKQLYFALSAYLVGYFEGLANP